MCCKDYISWENRVLEISNSYYGINEILCLETTNNIAMFIYNIKCYIIIIWFIPSFFLDKPFDF